MSYSRNCWAYQHLAIFYLRVMIKYCREIFLFPVYERDFTVISRNRKYKEMSLICF